MRHHMASAPRPVSRWAHCGASGGRHTAGYEAVMTAARRAIWSRVRLLYSPGRVGGGGGCCLRRRVSLQRREGRPHSAERSSGRENRADRTQRAAAAGGGVQASEGGAHCAQRGARGERLRRYCGREEGASQQNVTRHIYVRHWV